jgi:sulfane dehydrogenase subunit SoxC
MQPTPTPSRGIVKPLAPDRFLDHRLDGSGENNAEMRWGSVEADDYLTPNERFFVRSHGVTPVIDPGDWRLRIGGPAARRRLELTHDELLAMDSVTVVRALECAGNGRVLFGAPHGRFPPGTPWSLGAIGVAEWTGVPLADLLGRAGVAADAVEVLAEGLDAPRVRRPVPIAKAMEDALVVVAMNREPLPADHGFPARLLVPGWAAIASIKWLGSLEVTDRPVYTPWNTDVYVMKGPDYPPDAGGRPVVVHEQVMKSAIELDRFAAIAAGNRVLRGRSWSADSVVSRVEVSVDAGSMWRDARIRPPNLPGAWVRWSIDWDAHPGEHEILVRATDPTGRVQPDLVPWNDEGYLFGGVAPHPVRVVAVPAG